jgi:hypothetical protein
LTEEDDAMEEESGVAEEETRLVCWSFPTNDLLVCVLMVKWPFGSQLAVPKSLERDEEEDEADIRSCVWSGMIALSWCCVDVMVRGKDVLLSTVMTEPEREDPLRGSMVRK